MSVYGLVKLPDDTECTGQPFWFIAQHGPRGLYMLKGIWFSRNAAEQHLRWFHHRYPKSAFVYCASGMDTDIAELRHRVEAEARKIEAVDA